MAIGEKGSLRVNRSIQNQERTCKSCCSLPSERNASAGLLSLSPDCHYRCYAKLEVGERRKRKQRGIDGKQRWFLISTFLFFLENVFLHLYSPTVFPFSLCTKSSSQKISTLPLRVSNLFLANNASSSVFHSLLPF
uniref:Uncharacterized protein n=1 Tax=Nelumbo nucifera TaxID=4432 RepID=A0A822XDK2_NELNU|nr:TPA_asm: hypothetical protein HUJ06_019873 [Nelumbo nucifera]